MPPTDINNTGTDLPRLDMVVFDLDGVIIDSLPAMKESLDYAYRRAGLPGEAPFDEFRQHLGKSLKVIFTELNLPLNAIRDYETRADQLAPNVAVCAGMASLLGSLSAMNMPMAIATGKRTERAKHVLSSHKLDGYFAEILGSDRVQSPKPSGDSLRYISKVTNVDTGNMLFVGDAVSDMRCARDAGSLNGAVLWGQTDKETLCAEKPDFVFNTAADILDLVRKASPPSDQVA